MSKFKVGDKVVMVDDRQVYAPVSFDWVNPVKGQTYTVTGHHPTAADDVYLDGVTASWKADRFELVTDYEAKYNALVADLVAAHNYDITRLQRYDQIVEPFLPKPKQYHVTVLVDESGAEDASRGGALFGRPVVSVTEVLDA